jgi:hypothetical protein
VTAPKTSELATAPATGEADDRPDPREELGYTPPEQHAAERLHRRRPPRVRLEEWRAATAGYKR